MKPSLANAYQNRNWLLTTNVIENILFSAIFLGWPALVTILKSEDYYAHLCTTLNTRPRATVYDLATNSTRSRSMEMAVPLLGTDHPGLIIPPTLQAFNECCSHYKWSCIEQEKRLNKCFTLGSFLMNIFNLPIGWTVNKVGVKWIRSIGMLMSCVAFILFAISSARLSYLIMYAAALTSVGGNIILYTSLQVANLFGAAKTRSLGLLVGSHAASAITFPIFKVFYGFGIPLNLLFLILAALSILGLINTFCTVPDVAIPVGVESLPLGECKPILPDRIHNEKVDDEECKGSMSSMHADDQVANNKINIEATVMPLHRIIYMPMYLWSLIFVSMTQLRMMFFIGDLNQMLVYSTHNNIESVDLYIFIFGILQVCCLGTSHFAGGFVEWRNKKTVNPTPTEESLPFTSAHQQANCELPKPCTLTSNTPPPVVLMEKVDEGKVTCSMASLARIHESTKATNMEKEIFSNVHKSSIQRFVEQTDNSSCSIESTPERRKPIKHTSTKSMEKKIEKLKDTAIVFFIASTLMVFFGLLVLIPSLTIQVSTFVCYTLIRGLVPCAVGRLYSVAFNSAHHQTLIGLLLAFSAIFSIIQQPLFMIVIDLCAGDPYWVNISLLIPSLLCFGLPVHLLFHCKNLKQWKDSSTNIAVVQPVAVKMQYVDNKLNNRSVVPTEL
uniref:Major facilitator superfamily (MFS) profile domain-containing protein n=1 Tax=Strigamia maritima TaxID=126957 RepID=T1J9N8_STRMM